MVSSINPHHRHTQAFIRHPTPIEPLPKPDFPMKRFNKLAGDTVSFSGSDPSFVAAIGRNPTYGNGF